MEAGSVSDPRLALAGAELLALIRDWPAWTHRRVEHVTFLEADLVRRRISVDLSVTRRAPQAWGGLGGDDARLLPLGLLRKGRLAQFDLLQEGGEAVALLSSTQNGPLATEVLVAAAQMVAAGAGLGGPAGWGEAGGPPGAAVESPPPGAGVGDDPSGAGAGGRAAPVGGLRASLATIATADPGPAVEAWRALGVASAPDDAEAPWREALAADGWFMELALNLAHNFLVLASVPADVGERRVLKLSYVRRLAAERAPSRVVGVYAVRAQPAASARLVVTAAVAVPGAAAPRPLPRVTARVVALPEGRTAAWLATDRDGSAVATLAPGRYRVEPIDAPPGARPVGGGPEGEVTGTSRRAGGGPEGEVTGTSRRAGGGPEGEVTGTSRRAGGGPEGEVPGTSRRVGGGPEGALTDSPGEVVGGGPEVVLVAGATATASLAFEATAERPARARLPRALAPVTAIRLSLPVPGVRFCASAHLEVEAPDGLQVTRAELHEVHRPTEAPARGGPARADVVTEPVQRAHLYLGRTGRERTGSCEVWLRPRPGTILAPAALVAAVATALLGLVAWRLDELTATVGSTGSLLLFVPGVASAYVARPREDPFTSRALLAVRLWALVPALACLTVAATLLLARSTAVVRGVPVVGEPSGAALPLVIVAAGAAAVSLAVLAAAWRAATWPPEAGAPSSSDAAGPVTI